MAKREADAYLCEDGCLVSVEDAEDASRDRLRGTKQPALVYDRDGLTLARQAESSGKKAKTGTTASSYRKHTCPTCGLTARTTRDATLVCYDCGQVMSQE